MNRYMELLVKSEKSLQNGKGLGLTIDEMLEMWDLQDELVEQGLIM